MKIEGIYEVAEWTVEMAEKDNGIKAVYYRSTSDSKKGQLICTKDGDTYKGTYTDPNGSKGAIHITFTSEGFDGKYSSNINSTNPRGKWDGKLLSRDLIETSSRTQEDVDYSQKGVILVSGKSMNRTALGVVDAIFTMYPNITLEELQNKIPDSINPAAPVQFKSIFKPFTDREYGVFQTEKVVMLAKKEGFNISDTHFTKEEEIFTTSDGVKIYVSRLWQSKDTETGENDLQSLVDHVKQHEILVNEFEPSTKPFKKGKYQLHILNSKKLLLLQKGNKKKGGWIFWVLGILVILFILAFILMGIFKKEDEPVKISAQVPIEKIVAEVVIEEPQLKEELSKIVAVMDKVESGESVQGEVIEIRSVNFEKNKATLNENDLYIFDSIVSILKVDESLQILIEGHTSAEGPADWNQELSEGRAKNVKTYFISKEIEENRIEIQGKGSSELIDTEMTEEAHEKNRRTEITFKK